MSFLRDRGFYSPIFQRIRLHKEGDTQRVWLQGTIAGKDGRRSDIERSCVTGTQSASADWLALSHPAGIMTVPHPFLFSFVSPSSRWEESTMKFMLTFHLRPESKGRDEAIARFKKTGGQPPKGVTMIGRWTAADFSGGFDLLESDDVAALTEFSLQWSDLMELKLIPVIEDAQLAEVLQRVT